jgi:Protein of unknown function (DUF3631)
MRKTDDMMEEEYVILDEVTAFISNHLSLTRTQADAITLYASATHALPGLVTIGRMLFSADVEAAGKTLAMEIAAALSDNPQDASGTPYALQSELAAAAATPEKHHPTFYFDEIGGVYGESGLNKGNNNTLDAVLKKGYRISGKSSWSVNRTKQEFSVFGGFYLTGLKTAIPRDIRSRTIVIEMKPGRPKRYYDIRESVPQARELQESLGSQVLAMTGDISAFRARGFHPRLTGRKLEVWEPLLAVAWVMGGQRWLNRCLTAFLDLALSESDEIRLSPRQRVLKDMNDILDTAFAGKRFVGGLALADELRHLPDPLYGRTPNGIARLVADYMEPVQPRQERFGQERVRGYRSADIRRLWEQVKPEEMDDAELMEEDNPFAVTADVSELSFGNAA